RARATRSRGAHPRAAALPSHPGPPRPAPAGSRCPGHAGSGCPDHAGTGCPDHAGSGCPDRARTGCPGRAATRSGARPRASAAPGRCQPSPSACSAVPWPSRLRAGTTRSGPRRSPWQTWRSRRRSSSLQALSSYRPFQLVRGGLTGATPIGRRPIWSPRIYSCDARTVVLVPETIGRGDSNAAAKGQREVYRAELQVVVIHGARVKRAMCPAGSDRVDRQNARPPSKGLTDEAKAKDACRDRLLGLMVRMAPLTLALVALAMSWGCGAVRTVTRPAPAATGPTRHVLANGIPVIVQEHRGSDVVALQLWVRAGARDESAAELGLAHYLEALLLRGTASRPSG